MKTKMITYAEAIREAMSEKMRQDERIFLLGEDIGKYGGSFGVTKGMIEEFGPERIRETPISEAAIAGASIGAALNGLRPIMDIMFSDFITLTLDQIVNQAAKIHYMYGGQMSVPMVLRTASGSGTGAGSQHSQSLEAWLCHIPGLKVVIPSTPEDAKGLMKSAIDDPNPVMFLEQKLLYKTTGEVPTEDYQIPLGKADIKRKGSDITVLTYGRMVEIALQMATESEKQDVSMEVVDLRTLVPLDKETIFRSVEKTKNVMIVHEACKTGGYGAELSALIAESSLFSILQSPIKRVCGEDVPIPFNKLLEQESVPTVNRF